MTTELMKTPSNAPGFRVAEFLRDGVRVAKTDSVAYSATSPATTIVCRVPANTLILGVVIEVTTAWSTTAGTILGSLGDSDGASDLFSMTSDQLSSTGWKASFAAKNYTAAQDIIFTETNTSSDTLTGAGHFYLLYSTESDKRLTYDQST